MHQHKTLKLALALSLILSFAGCADNTETVSEDSPVTAETAQASDADTAEETAETTAFITEESITVKETYIDSSDESHALLVEGETAEYSGILVEKTGDADGDEADFYGTNAAVFVTDQGTLTVTDSIIKTNGKHANAVFSYGEGSTVNIADSYIETEGNCSGGLMTTGGGTTVADNLTVLTHGNSSAAIRSDRGGGTVIVTNGSYTTEGVGSPVIYSTADITVNDAVLTSKASQGVVVEGKNSVTLNNVALNADNNTKNSNHSSYYQAVMIYQSMSGDADEGLSSFTMNGGTLTNQNGDIFFVTNTTTEITLTNVTVVNNDSEGVFLRADAAGWGNDGSNGGKVTLYASGQSITGDILVSDISGLNLYLKDGSSLESSVNEDNTGASVYVELDEDSVWTLTGDSYISSLTCDKDSIQLNGYSLYVDGVLYEEGTASQGTAFSFESSSSGSHSHRR